MDDVFAVQIFDSTEDLATELQNSFNRKSKPISCPNHFSQITLTKFHDDENFQTIVDAES